MNIKLPERLFCEETRLEVIQNNSCTNCLLLRRSKYIDFPTDELDTSIWSRQDIFGLSLNIFLCNLEELNLQSEIEDVRIFCYDDRNVLFLSNEQRNGIDINTVNATIDENTLLKMKLGSLDKLSGSYPFGQIGSKNFKEHIYELRVISKPLLFNAFHYEIDVYSSENEYQNPLDRNQLKRYQKSLASDIRNRILLGKLIEPLQI